MHDILCNRIRDIRSTRKLSQEQLALRVGISRQTILSIENGRSYPSVFLAYQIANVLDASLDQVFSVKPRDHGRKVGPTPGLPFGHRLTSQTSRRLVAPLGHVPAQKRSS